MWEERVRKVNVTIIIIIVIIPDAAECPGNAEVCVASIGREYFVVLQVIHLYMTAELSAPA